MTEKLETGPDEHTTASQVEYAELTAAVRELASIMRQADLERLEVARGDFHLLLCARSTASTTSTVPGAPQVAGDPDTSPWADEDLDSDLHTITAPMVGTFYEAPSPGEPPFVRVGDQVEVGQTVAIIEAMKIMNEIVADRPGTVTTILVENAETVEYGQPLFTVQPHP